MTHTLTTISLLVFLRFRKIIFEKLQSPYFSSLTSIFEINDINKLTPQLCLEKEYNIVGIIKNIISLNYVLNNSVPTT